jgi:hypothetical protein
VPTVPITGTGGLVLLGVAFVFAVGWYIIARRARKLSEIT